MTTTISTTKTLRVGKLKIPVAALVRALRAAIKDFRAVAADDKDDGKVTAAEVAEDVGVFVASFSTHLGLELLK